MSQLEPESFLTQIHYSCHSVLGALGESGVSLNPKTPNQCLANEIQTEGRAS